MENCLFNQLKGEISQDFLPKFGCVALEKISVQPSFNSNYYFLIKSDTTKKVVGTTEDSHFCNNTGVDIGSTYEVPVNSTRFINVGLDKGIFYFEKYNIKEIDTSFSSPMAKLRTSQIQFMPSLIRVNFSIDGYIEEMKELPLLQVFEAKPCSLINGSISAFTRFPNLQTIKITNLPSDCKIRGLFEDLGPLVALTTIAFDTGSFEISGSLEDFVVAQRTNGRTTCEGITITLFGTGVTFNGETIYHDIDAVLSWTADTITYKGVTIDG